MATTDNAIMSEKENVGEIQALTSQVEQLSNAADFWNSLMLWGLAVAALAAIFIVVTTRLALTRTSQAAEAQSRLDAAKDRDKDVKIATLMEQTEGEKLARLRLEAAIQPRDLSLEEQSALKDVMHKFAGRVVSVRSYALDTEGSRLATIILSALHAVGIQVSDQRGNLLNLSAGWNVVEGVQIAGPHVHDDLINALLKSPLGTNPRLKMFRKEDPKILDAAPVEILVGVKPVAVIP